MPTPDVLTVEGLTRRYGRRLAVDGVSFSVRSGDVFGFLGPNGAGKTTTIRIVLGLIRSSGGAVTTFGERGRRASLAARSRIGAMVEVPSFYPHLSGRRNLLLLGALAGNGARDEVDRALAEVRLAAAAGDPVRTYSQGMRQRLGLAQALLGEPDLVILDEPTNGLDPHGVQEMRKMILDQNRERGTTFLISSHQLSEVEQLCNRVAILRKGKLLVTGPVGEILDREVCHYDLEAGDPEAARAALAAEFELPEPPAGSTRIRVAAGRRDAPRIAELLVAAGVPLTELTPVRPSLEDYFLRVTEGGGWTLGAEGTPGLGTRLARAIRVEAGKAVRQRGLWVYLALLILTAAIWGPLQYRVAKRQEAELAPPTGGMVIEIGGAARAAPEEEEAGPDRGANGFYVLAASTRAGLTLAALLILLFASGLLSGEGTAGTYRMLLTRPVTRADVLVGKAVILLGLVVLFVLAVGLTGAILGALTGGYGDHVDVRYGQVDYTTAELTGVALTTLALAPLALFATAAFGLLISALFDSAATAITVAVLGGIAAVAANLALPPAAAKLNFLTYVDKYAGVFQSFSRGLSEHRLDLRFIGPGIVIPAVASLVFLLVALIMFHRRDIHA